MKGNNAEEKYWTLPQMSNKHLNLLRNTEGDLAFVVNQPPGLKHLEGVVGTCVHYSKITGLWYFHTDSGATYMFRDDELIPIGGEELRYTEPRLVLKTGAVAYA